MVTIYPFAGVRPSCDEAYKKVPSVPYDVVTTEEAAAEIKSNEYSLLRVIRSDAELSDIDPYDNAVYEQAAFMYEKLKASGYLKEDDSDSYYIYRITLKKESLTFTGLTACVSVEEFINNVIKKHELTRYDKEEDRTRHIDTVSAHTGQVFLLYKDINSINKRISEIADENIPAGEFVSKEGNIHRIYRIEDEHLIEEITNMFKDVPNLYIADGHHRAKSSVNVYLKRRSEGRLSPDAEKFMGVLFSDKSVKIYGSHRLVRDLAGMNADQFLSGLSLRFEISKIKKVDLKKNFISPLEKSKKFHVIHLYLESQWYELTRPIDESADAVDVLDVSVLQNLVLDDMLAIIDQRSDPRLSFVGGVLPLEEIVKEVDSGEYSAAFIMQPITSDQVINVADAGLIMPPKSTWFEPKLLSGMVIHEIH